MDLNEIFSFSVLLKKKKIYYFIEKTKKQGEYQQKYIRLHDEKK